MWQPYIESATALADDVHNNREMYQIRECIDHGMAEQTNFCLMYTSFEILSGTYHGIFVLFFCIFRPLREWHTTAVC